MREFWGRFFEVCLRPEDFFERVRVEHSWRMPLLHLLAVCLILSLGSVLAWAAGVAGDTPLNSSLTAQMDVYPYWHSNLLPRFGLLSYPLAAGLIFFEMVLISVFYTPVIFLVFRGLGGSKESGGLLRSFQGFVYGLTPVVFGGFLPGLALIVGVYATLLQLYRGPAITLTNRTVFSYLLVVLVLAYVIARYWQGGLL